MIELLRGNTSSLCERPLNPTIFDHVFVNFPRMVILPFSCHFLKNFWGSLWHKLLNIFKNCSEHIYWRPALFLYFSEIPTKLGYWSTTLFFTKLLGQVKDLKCWNNFSEWEVWDDPGRSQSEKCEMTLVVLQKKVWDDPGCSPERSVRWTWLFSEQ